MAFSCRLPTAARAAALAAAVLLLAAACTGRAPAPGSDASGSPAAGPPAGAVPQAASGPPPLPIVTEPVPIAELMAGKADIIHMRITDQGFAPPVITTTVGGRVRIHLRNGSSRAQNLSIPRFGIYSRSMDPGDENYIEFTASQKGDWPFFSDPTEGAEPLATGRLQVE